MSTRPICRFVAWLTLSLVAALTTGWLLVTLTTFTLREPATFETRLQEALRHKQHVQHWRIHEAGDAEMFMCLTCGHAVDDERRRRLGASSAFLCTDCNQTSFHIQCADELSPVEQYRERYHYVEEYISTRPWLVRLGCHTQGTLCPVASLVDLALQYRVVHLSPLWLVVLVCLGISLCVLRACWRRVHSSWEEVKPLLLRRFGLKKALSPPVTPRNSTHDEDVYEIQMQQARDKLRLIAEQGEEEAEAVPLETPVMMTAASSANLRKRALV